MYVFDCKMNVFLTYYIPTGAYEQEHATQLYSCHGVFIDRFIFRSNLLWMRLPWECHNQSQDTNWRHCVTGPELPFFHKRKGVPKIDQSVKMPWHRLRMGVASSCSSAPDIHYLWPNSSTGWALHQHRRGQGSHLRSGLNFSGDSLANA